MIDTLELKNDCQKKNNKAAVVVNAKRYSII
jgi:hypothetical protein